MATARKDEGPGLEEAAAAPATGRTGYVEWTGHQHYETRGLTRNDWKSLEVTEGAKEVWWRPVTDGKGNTTHRLPVDQLEFVPDDVFDRLFGAGNEDGFKYVPEN